MGRVNLQQALKEPYELQDLIQAVVSGVVLTIAGIFLWLPELRFEDYLLLVLVQLFLATPVKVGLYFSEQNSHPAEIGLYVAELWAVLGASWLPDMHVMGIGGAVLPVVMILMALASLFYTLVMARILEK